VLGRNIMTKTFRNLTAGQERVLGQIAANNDQGHNLYALAALEEDGLIVRRERQKFFFDGLPPVTIRTWEMPLSIHAEWCLWCAGDEHGED